jgi:hypothetical protein
VTSRPDSRNPVASGVKCGPHGGKKSKTKSWLGADAGQWLTTEVCKWGLRRLTTKTSGYLVEPQNQDRRLGGQRWDPSTPRSFKVEDTHRDRKAYVKAKRIAVAGHPSDGATTRIPKVPLGGVYPSIIEDHVWFEDRWMVAS